jgi:hypothetical protein
MPPFNWKDKSFDREAGTLFRPGVDHSAPYWSCIGGGNGGAMVRPRAVVSDSWQSDGPWVWWFLSNLRLDHNSAIGDLGNSDGRSRVCVGNKS